MSTAINWLTDNWAMVLTLAGVLVAVANAVSSHWGESSPGLRRALMFVVDLLSIVTSRGSRAGVGPIGRLKLPGQLSIPSPESKARVAMKKHDDGSVTVEYLWSSLWVMTLAGIGLLVYLMLVACGLSWQTKLTRSLDGVAMTARRSHMAVLKVCEPTLEKCIAEKKNPCPELVACQVNRNYALKAMLTALRAAAAGQSAVKQDLQDEAGAKMAAASEALADLLAVLRVWGVKL